MKITEQWYDLYKSLYGTKFNRLLVIGSIEDYERFHIQSIDELSDLLDEYGSNNEYYISLYDYDTDKSLLAWNNMDPENYKNCTKNNVLLIRFRENTKEIREETAGLNDVDKFMFVRTTINLGFDKTMIDDVKTTYRIFEEMFNIKPWIVFNGYDECYLYIFMDELKLENPSALYYGIHNFIVNNANITTMNFSTTMDPFSQLVALPGTQRNVTRLYVKPFNVNDSYNTIIKNSENYSLDSTLYNIKDQDTSFFEDTLKDADKKIARIDPSNTNTIQEKIYEILNSVGSKH